MLKKCFGQVLLTNHQVKNKMIELLDLNISRKIIEIGFGHLFLTNGLFEIDGAELHLFEIDKSIFDRYYKQLAMQKSHVYHADFVKFIQAEKLNKQDIFIVISNIAFNIFKATITNIIKYHYFNIKQMVILIPQEIGASVIEEDCAFAKFISFFYKTELMFEFSGKQSFSRTIDFKNCVVNFILRDNYLELANKIDVNLLYCLIQKIFENKRKKLKHNKNIDAKLYQIEELRAQELTHKQIIDIYNDQFKR